MELIFLLNLAINSSLTEQFISVSPAEKDSSKTDYLVNVLKTSVFHFRNRLYFIYLGAYKYITIIKAIYKFHQ